MGKLQHILKHEKLILPHAPLVSTRMRNVAEACLVRLKGLLFDFTPYVSQLAILKVQRGFEDLKHVRDLLC